MFLNSIFVLFVFGYLYQSTIFILHVQYLTYYIYQLFHWTTLFFFLLLFSTSFLSTNHRSMTTTPGTPSQRDLDQKARQLQAWEENIQRQQEELMEAR